MKKISILSLTLAMVCVISGMTYAGLNDGLVAYYPFNGNANDESGNGNHGTIYGATLTTDRDGNAYSAYSFDGVNDYIFVANSASLNLEDTISISYWIKLETSGPYYMPYHIIEKSGSWGIGQRKWDINSGITSSSGSYHNVWIMNLKPRVYYNFVMTFDGSILKLYKNGLLAGSTDCVGKMLKTNSNIMISKYEPGGDYYFDGILDDICIYNRALSEDEIKQIYSGLGEISPGLAITIEASHILFKLPSDANSEEVETARRKAITVQNMIKNGAYFSEMAKKYSECPSKDRGGHLNVFKKEAMVKPFADKAFSMKAGEISDPVRTRFGWHIIKVEKVNSSSKLTDSEAYPIIRKKLTTKMAKEKVYNAANKKHKDFKHTGGKAGFKEIYNKTHIVDLKTEGKLVKTEKIKTIAEIDYKEKKFRFSFFTKDFDKKDWNKEEKLIPLHIRHTNVAPQYMGILILHPKNVKILESKQKGFLVRDNMFSKKYGWEELLPYKDHRNAQMAMGAGEKVIDILLSKIPFAKEAYKLLLEHCSKQNKEYYDSIFEGKENFVATMIPVHIPKAIIGFTETAWSIEIPFDLRNAQGEQKMSFWINPAFGDPSVNYSAGTWSPGFGRLEGIHIDFALSERRKNEAERQKLALGIPIKKYGSFIAYDDGTVRDTKTNLMWAAKDNGSNINWSNAKSYCENYRGGSYTDWRMPTQDELAGLYDKSKRHQSDCGLSAYLTELIPITCPSIWALKSRGSGAALFNFVNGERGWFSKGFRTGFRALPVRSGKDEAKIAKQPQRMDVALLPLARIQIPARLWSKEDGIVHLHRRLELIKAVKWGRSWYPTFESTPSSINPNSQEPQVVVFSEGRKVYKERVLSSKNFRGWTKWYSGYTIEGSVYIAVNESFKELFPNSELRWSPLADPAEADNAVVSSIRLDYHHKKKFVYHATNLPNIYADVIHFTKFSPMGHIHGFAPEIVLFNPHNRSKTRLEFKWRLKDDEKKKDTKLSVSEAKLKEASTGSDSKKNARQKLKDMGISFDLNTFLLYAGKGNTKVMDLFLSSGMHPDGENNHGRTALFLAIKRNRTDAVVFLLDRGANANHGDTRSGDTPLLKAVIFGHKDIVTALLNKGADVNVRDNRSKTVLMYATPDVDSMKLLLKNGAKVNVRDDRGETALMYATPDVDSMKLLLKNGAKVNVRDNRGKTALMYATPDVDSMKLLLKNGAKVNVRDNRGKTALMYTASNADSVKLLLKNGAKVNVRDDRGKTALMYARYSVNSVKLLLKKGAIVSPSYDYLTDIVESNDKDIAEVVKILLDKGAKPTSATLLAAVYNRNYDIINSFLIKGVDMNQRDLNGRTALMIAANMVRPDIVKLLISKGANVNLLSPLHALHWALNWRGGPRKDKAHKAVYEIVKVLIENGADMNRRDPEGMTALGYIEGFVDDKGRVPFERIVKLMKKNGAVK